MTPLPAELGSGNIFATVKRQQNPLLFNVTNSPKQMSLKIITLGDMTDHGGTVISGSPNHDIRGRAIARLGDKVACPLVYPGGKPHGINKITSGHDTLTVDGIPVAVEGCTTECGCKLIGSVPADVN